MARQSSHVIVPKDTPGPQKAARPRDPVASGERDAAHNRVASHNYFLLEKFEAGVALRGTEVKSIREGKANLKDSYGLIKDGEAFLLNVHIGPYSHGNISNHDETRTRKLLLHSYEEMRKAYVRIFDGLGLTYRMVPADSGAMGGSTSAEFQVLVESGEDAIVACGACDYAANVEVATVRSEEKSAVSASDSPRFMRYTRPATRASRRSHRSCT